MDLNFESLFQPFITDVFQSFDSEKISYVVLRNYDSLPMDPGHDLDILVESGALSKVGILLKNSAEKKNWQLVHHVERYGFQSFIFIPTKHGNINESPKWDIWDPICWKGFAWIDTSEVMKTRYHHPNGFYIPSPGIEAVILLLKEVLQAGFIKKKYLKRISTFVKNDPCSFNTMLKSFFGENITKSITKSVHQREWESIENETSNLRRYLIKHSLLQNPIRTIFTLFQFIEGHFIDFIRGRNSLMIRFIGPDGSGKSTISSNLLENLKDLFEDIRYFHGHYQIMPEISTILPIREPTGEIHKKPNEEVKNQHNHGIYNKIKETLMISYYTIDYILGHISTIKMRNKSHLIIFDRYFFDYMIQPSSLKHNSCAFRILMFFVPKPDLLVYLKAPAEVIHTRKQELTKDEITRQAKICNLISTTMSYGYCIDNNQPLETVLSHIRCLVVETLVKNHKG